VDGRSWFVVKTAPKTSPENGPSMRQDSAIEQVTFHLKNVKHVKLSNTLFLNLKIVVGILYAYFNILP